MKNLFAAASIAIGLALAQMGTGLAASHVGPHPAPSDFKALMAAHLGAHHPLAPASRAGVRSSNAGATATACQTALNVAASPNVGPSNNSLLGVAAISSTNIWAVGASATETIAGPLYSTLIVHFNGTTWSVVPSPNPTSSVPDSGLFGIAAASATNIWAVGAYANQFGEAQTLVEHYDGRAWTIVVSPNVGMLNNSLSGVAVVAGSPVVWAAGNYVDGSATSHTLIERFNGSSWAIVSSPNVGPSNNELNGIAAVSASSVWAVGDSTAYLPFPTSRTLTEHFNGSTWSVIASPNHDTEYGADHNILYGLATIPGTSTLVAVGGATLDVPPAVQLDQTLVERWDGSRWTMMASADIGPAYEHLNGVAARAGNDIWAVGLYVSSTAFDATLVEHYDGTTWSIVASPNVGTLNSKLLSVAAVRGSIAAVGDYGTGDFTSPGPSRTLIEQACGI